MKVNFWTLCIFDRKLDSCFRCIGFSEDKSLFYILAFVAFHLASTFYRVELYKGKTLVYREASLQ